MHQLSASKKLRYHIRFRIPRRFSMGKIRICPSALAINSYIRTHPPAGTCSRPVRLARWPSAAPRVFPSTSFSFRLMRRSTSSRETSRKPYRKHKGIPMPKSKDPFPIQEMLTSPTLPLEQRLELLRGLLNDQSPATKAILATLLENLGSGDAEGEHMRMAKEYREFIRHIQERPLRHATFIELWRGDVPGRREKGDANGSKSESDSLAPALLDDENVPRALLLFDDATLTYTVVPDRELAKRLRCGDRLLTDNKGRVVLHH